MERFENREQAGLLLAGKLQEYRNKETIVLAIPRGGVPVGYEVAKALKLPLDILMVKKIGAPGQPELAVGAVSEDSTPIFNDSIVRALNLRQNWLNHAADAKIKDLKEQVQRLRGKKSVENIEGKTVLVIDDGIATGSTLFAAIQFLRRKNPAKIVVAAPVGAPDTISRLKKVSDDVVCLMTPEPFSAVGLWYETFDQVEDEDVMRLLSEARFHLQHPEIPTREISVSDGDARVLGELTQPENAKGLVIFAHGSGSSRKSPRNRSVAAELNKLGFSTLLFDLLTEEEANERRNVFNIGLLARRLLLATDAALAAFREKPSVGYFGASTGGGAALMAAAQSAHKISAVVSRGGRPDLAEAYLPSVSSPTLLIVGGKDDTVLELNQRAATKIKNSKLAVVPGATHLFEEPGAMDEVIEYAAQWFGEYLQTDRKHSAAKEKVVTELESGAHIIRNSQSWDDLIRKLAKSRIVMLGEATHGTEEFYSTRRHISEALIRDHGFKFIAVEGDWPDCQKLNSYIQSGSGGSARDIMKQFERWPTWMWANDETALLVEWMKNFRAGFYGLDVYSLFESMDHVIRFAKKVVPELASTIQEQYACFDPFDRDEKAYARYLTKFPEGCRHEVLTSLRKILRLRLEAINSHAPDLFSAQQNARIVAHAEQYYRTMLFGGPQSWNVRDQHMMETLDLLLNREGPDSKCIVWAHNSHIGDYHATDMLEEGYVNLGGLARERFGMEQVALVGFGTYEGQVLAGPAWEGKEQVMNLPAAKESSFEYFCHKAALDLGTKEFYVLFDSELRQGSLGTRSFGHRAVGVVYDSHVEKKGHNYVKTVPAKRYDAFVFIDRTHALASIRTRKNKLDMPETWPGGI